MRTIIISALILCGGCSKEKPPLPAAKPSGLLLAKSKRTPVDLANAFHQSLVANDSEGMVMISLLGQGIKNWKVISDAQQARTLKLLQAELVVAEKKPRENRTEKEQARCFTLHSQIGNLKKGRSDEYWKAQEEQLPSLRLQFIGKNYLKFILALSEAGINPAQVKLRKVDTSRITTNYLDGGLHGGTTILHYENNGTKLEAGIAFECVEFRDEGWLIIGQPQVIRHSPIGPQPLPAIENPEPFSTPTGE